MNAAIVPEVVLATLDLQRALRSYVALEDLRVVAHLFNDVVGPLVIKLQIFAVITLFTQQVSHIGSRRIRGFFIDVFRVNAHLFCIKHGKQRPADNSVPLIITSTYDRTQRLF